MPKSLTALSVKNARAEDGKRTEVPDGSCRGLFLVIQPTGRKSWALRYRNADGRTRKLTLGTALVSADGGEPNLAPVLGSAMTLAGARALAQASLHGVALGKDPAAEKRIEKAREPEAYTTVGAMVQRFIKRHCVPNMKASSRHEAERLLTREVLPLWKDRKIEEITRTDVRELVDGVVERGKLTTANRVFSLVRLFFN